MSYLNIARPRLLGILSLALACLGLTACGGSSGDSTQATTTPTVAGAPATSGASTTSPSVSTSTSTPRSTAPAQGAPGATASAGRQAQVFKLALGSYERCLRQSGVALPSASGKTPFSLKGVDTKSAQFKAAAKKCRAVLIGALRSARPAQGSVGGGGSTSSTTTTPSK
jgi:hypothetical protein